MSPEFAVPGAAHRTIPARAAHEAPGRPRPASADVLPWLCPGCDRVVAETVAWPTGNAQIPGLWLPAFEYETYLVDYSPVRRVEADEDNVPFFAPSTREVRRGSGRRTPDELSRRNFVRLLGERSKAEPGLPMQGDHGAIRRPEFDMVCRDCPRRLRIRLPSA